MKALTITQPWASLIAIGAKRIETRSWTTHTRGQIAIHAATSFPSWARDACADQPFLRELTRGGLSMPELPRGAVVALADVLTVLGTTDPALKLTPKEAAFGNYADGRWAWLLVNIRPLKTPVLCRGALGLWTVPSDIEQCICEQLR